MAFVTTETSAKIWGGGPQGLLLVSGTYASSGGGTGGVIAAGYTNSSGTLTAVSPSTGSIGGRKILNVVITTGTADAVTPISAVTYDTTLDSDKVTLTTSADGTGFYMLICENAGQ